MPPDDPSDLEPDDLPGLEPDDLPGLDDPTEPAEAEPSTAPSEGIDKVTDQAEGEIGIEAQGQWTEAELDEWFENDFVGPDEFLRSFVAEEEATSSAEGPSAHPRDFHIEVEDPLTEGIEGIVDPVRYWPFIRPKRVNRRRAKIEREAWRELEAQYPPGWSALNYGAKLRFRRRWGEWIAAIAEDDENFKKTDMSRFAVPGDVPEQYEVQEAPIPEDAGALGAVDPEERLEPAEPDSAGPTFRWIFVGGGFGVIGLVLVGSLFVFGGSESTDPDAASTPAQDLEEQAAAVPDAQAPTTDELALDAPGTEIAPPDYTTDEVMIDLVMLRFLGISLFHEDFIPFLNDPTLPDNFALPEADPLLRTSFFAETLEELGLETNLGPVPALTHVGSAWLTFDEPVEDPQALIFDQYAPMANIVFPPDAPRSIPSQNMLVVGVEIAADLTSPAVCAGKELVLILSIHNPEWGDQYVANPSFPGEYYAGGNFFPNFNLNDCTPTSYADTYLSGKILAGLANSGAALFTVNDGVTRGVVLLSDETVNADASLRTILFEHPTGETFFPENTRYQSVPDIFDPAGFISDGITTAQYDFTLVPMEPDPQETVEDNTQASPTIDLEAKVEAFVAEFAAAATSDDSDFLLARLHPLVVELSDEETCSAFVSREIAALEQYRATGPAQQTVFEFVINDQAVTVDPAFEIPVAFTFSGQEFTDNAQIAPVDGVMHYFATCR